MRLDEIARSGNPATNWERIFERWAEPPGETENERIENAITAVRKAMDADPFLAENTRVFVQGSYKNRVNVRRDSDVDIGVIYTGNSFFVDYPPGSTAEAVGNSGADFTYSQFKDLVGKALVKRFGAAHVTRGSKAFDIHENTYRLDADVVPAFIHRRYRPNGDFICGVELLSDDGQLIINWPLRVFDDQYWPDQHYENGVEKNKTTSYRYKSVVRILKSLRNVMESEGFTVAKPIKGFVLECLTWNVPNPLFAADSWDGRLQQALAFLWTETKEAESCSEWGEVSEWKYLFRGSPDSKRIECHQFIDAAWDYIGVRN